MHGEKHFPMNYYVPIVLLVLVIALAALFSTAGETTVLISVRSLYFLLMVCSLSLFLPSNLEMLPRLCFCLGLAGTLMSAVTLLSVVCSKVGLALLAFAINRPNYMYGLPKMAACFGNPNGFGLFLVFSITGTIILFALGKHHRENNKRVALLFYIALAVQSASLILTFSRAAIIALSVFVLSFVWLNRRRCCYTLPLTLLGVAILFSKQAFAKGGLGEIVKALFNGRIQLWAEGLNLFAQYPFLGTGLGGWAATTGSQLSLHNTYLHLAVELGLVGLILYFLFIVLFFQDLLKAMNQAVMRKSRYVVISGLYSLCIGLLVHQLFESYLYHGLPLFLFAIIPLRSMMLESGMLYRFCEPAWKQCKAPGAYRRVG